MIDIFTAKKDKLKWKHVKVFKADYKWSRCQVQATDDELHIKFSGHRNKYVGNIYFFIPNYKEHSAFEVLDALDVLGFGTSNRHAYDAILYFYHKNDLDLGLRVY